MAVHHPDIDNDAAMIVVLKIEDEGAEIIARSLNFGRRNPLHDFLEKRGHTLAGASGNTENLVGRAAEKRRDFLLHFVDAGKRRVDFRNDRNNDESLLARHSERGQSLGLHTLRRVDEKQ